MKKNILSVIFAIILAFSFSLNALAAGIPADDAVATALPKDVAACLSQYFEMREAQFENRQTNIDYITGTAVCSESVIAEQPDRNSFIDNWADELDIIVADVNISYRVKDVMESSSVQNRLLVYEWVMVDYYCKGFDELETMGFGTNHVITIDRASNQAKIACDSYDEITGYLVGNSDDLEYLHGSANNLEPASVATTEAAPLTGASASASYNYIYAVNYSSQWCGISVAGDNNPGDPSGYNPSFYYWNDYGGDCANFVSQCLLAGGFTMDPVLIVDKTTVGWWAITHSSQKPKSASNNEASSAWRGAPQLKTYLESTLGYSETRLTSSADAKVGNPLYYNLGKAATGDAKHFMIIVGTNNNGQVLYNAHTYDAYKYPLTFNSWEYYYMINLR